MKPGDTPPLVDPLRYQAIKPRPTDGFFQNFPGVYCQACGKDFALYSYSAHQPDGEDENQKPFYRKCLLCLPESVGNKMLGL